MILLKDPATKRYILKVDASIYKLLDCHRYAMLRLVQGYDTPQGAVKQPSMEYGTAGHKFLQARYEGKSFEEQLACATKYFSSPDIIVPDNEWRNIGHLVSTLVAYDNFYKASGDLLDVAKSEYRFTIPFFKTDLVEVLLCGTVDIVGAFAGFDIICDHKFTSAWNTSEYFAEYDLSSQLMIYKYVMDSLFEKDFGCMINGIFIAKAKPAVFKRSEIIRFSKEQVNNLMRDFKQKVTLIALAVGCLEERNGEPIESVSFFPNYCACIKRYGEKATPCTYTILCKQPNFADALQLAESVFEKRAYDPSTHQL